MSDRLLDANEVAKMLGMTVGWVRSHTRSGAIPHIKLGKYPRYREADLRDWLDSCTKPGRPITFRKGGP